MTLEQFEQVNARLREHFDPIQLPEWWGSRQPLLDGRFVTTMRPRSVHQGRLTGEVTEHHT
jgi:hypothetical protein